MGYVDSLYAWPFGCPAFICIVIFTNQLEKVKHIGSTVIDFSVGNNRKLEKYNHARTYYFIESVSRLQVNDFLFQWALESFAVASPGLWHAPKLVPTAYMWHFTWASKLPVLRSCSHIVICLNKDPGDCTMHECTFQWSKLKTYMHGNHIQHCWPWDQSLLSSTAEAQLNWSVARSGQWQWA